MTFPRWDVLLGYSLMAALFAWELLGVFDAKYLTITHWIRSWMPLWMRAMILGWLCYHFLLGSQNIK